MKTTEMRPFLLSILLMFICLNPSFSQNKTDENGLKQGKWVKNYNDGSIRYEGQFNNNKPTGEFRYYYKNGNLKAITLHSASGDSALTTSYHKNGKKWLKVHTSNN